MKNTTYTVTKTYTVESALTTLEAAAVIQDSGDPSAFALDIASRATERRLSPKQAAWLQVLAAWASQPKAEARPALRFPAILALLKRAAEAQKRLPCIRLLLDGEQINIRLARSGKANVVGEGDFETREWFGAIQPDGSWRGSRSSSGDLEALLALVEADPAAVAKQHGVATDHCCFCRRPLSTKESRSVGYGETCADNYGLPWGTVDPDLDAEGAEVLDADPEVAR
jgi:hypothetical protein